MRVKADQQSDQSVRVTFVYTDTGQGHKSSADGLAEWITRNAREANAPLARITHVDIYRLAKVFLFRRASQHYQFLCSHARWLYNLLFRITDSRIAKKLTVRAVIHLYGRRIRRVIEEADPDLIVVMHPLFMSDILCELRDQSSSKWKIVSFITDLGIAHAGWVSVSLDAAIFVCAGEIEKLRNQRCLPVETRVFVAQAPVRAPFGDCDTWLDGKIMEALGLDRPYLLYIPGLQPVRSLVRQVEHLTSEFKDMQFVVVGSVPTKAISYLRRINSKALHLESLSSVDMSAAMRNAEIVAGKAGPAVMAEAARVHVRFIPTAEVGRQEVGNVLVGRLMYGTDPLPSWGRTARQDAKEIATVQARLGDRIIMGDAEVYSLLMNGIT